MGLLLRQLENIVVFINTETPLGLKASVQRTPSNDEIDEYPGLSASGGRESRSK